MPVLHITNEAEWAAKIGSATPAVVDFTAVWCGPCKAIAPVFEGLSSQFPQLNFLKVDVDEQKEIAKAAGISAMPTFQIYQNGAKIKESVGANPQKLKALIAEVAATVVPAKGIVLGGEASSDDTASAREKIAAAAEARLKAAVPQ